MIRESRQDRQQSTKTKHNLTKRIFIGLLFGAIVGLLVYYVLPPTDFRDRILVNGLFYLVGTGFMRLMQMLVVPLVFFSIVGGAMSMGDTKKLGRVGVKTLCFYMVTTALAITLALVVASFIRPGIGLDLAHIARTETEISNDANLSTVDILLNIIPKNPFLALAEGDMLQVIFFALFLGIILASLGNKVPQVSRLINEANDFMMAMTFAVMQVAPIGVFALIARTFGQIGFNGFLPMVKYMLSVSGSLALQLFLVYGLILLLFAGLNPLKFLRKFSPVLAFAFSTASSGATVPINISTLEDMGVSKKISSFTIPLGATINMDGTAIMQGCAVVFAAQAYGHQLTLANFLTVIGTATLASVGTAGVPGVGLITLAMVFQSVGLPIEAIGIIMGIDRILDMARTAVNISGDAIVTTIVTKQEGLFDANRYNAVVLEDDENLDDVEL